MTEFSEAEKQLLIAFIGITQTKGKPTHEALEQFGKNSFKEDLVDWTEAFKNLTEKGLLREADKVYSLTDQGEIHAKEVHTNYSIQEFSKWLTRSEQSKAFASFCERVYGKNLCQCNMMDMKQLDKLLEILNLNKDNRGLDLGCGIGAITEYISDLTGAHITGIDFATGAIKRAGERTRKKQNRLTFREGNMNNLEFPMKSFDTIIAIDTLYFVDDLEKTIGQMKAILKPNGQMGIFFTQMIKPEDPKELLLPERTKLAQALKKHSLSFKTWNFTENEYRIWRKQKQVAEDLRSEFAAEGNLYLYSSRIEESEYILKFVDADRLSRHLYHVQLQSNAD
jgi:ubiquinone/menaquinone biosynthesis C-methylase UbiE